MSVIATYWVDSIQVGNPHAKALLRFLASHNFHKPGFIFKNSTYVSALEVCERTVIRSLQLLEEKGFILKENTFDKNGRQKTNTIYLNIPQEFIDDYEKRMSINLDSQSYDTKSVKGEGVTESPLGVSQSHPRGVTESPTPPKKTPNLLIESKTCETVSFPNNNINNNINNKERGELKKRSPLSLVLNNFEPSQETVNIAINGRINVDEELSKFNDYRKSHGKKYADLDCAFKLWINRSIEYKQKTPIINEVRSTVKEWGPGHPAWESIHGRNKQDGSVTRN